MSYRRMVNVCRLPLVEGEIQLIPGVWVEQNIHGVEVEVSGWEEIRFKGNETESTSATWRFTPMEAVTINITSSLKWGLRVEGEGRSSWAYTPFIDPSYMEIYEGSLYSASQETYWQATVSKSPTPRKGLLSFLSRIFRFR
jgi:hypothetical protein